MAERENENDEAELEGGRMPFLKHLVELRDRLRNAAFAFIGAFLVCWYFADKIFAYQAKHEEVRRRSGEEPRPDPPRTKVPLDPHLQVTS